MRIELEDLKPSSLKFHGFYRGVVEATDENAVDGVKRGRCKVRVYGVHSQQQLLTEGKEGIPTEHLPWAEPVFGLLEGSSEGYGLFCVPQIGSHVFVFFENGNHMLPRYFGSAPAATDFPVEFATGYPNNIIFKTHGGHLIEVDSTEGNERINIQHPMGTIVLMDKDGNLTITVTGNANINVTGICNITGNPINLN